MEKNMKKIIKKKTGWLCSMFFVCMGLTGCAATELEERCFPVVTTVGYEDNEVTYALGFPRGSMSDAEDATLSEIKVPTAKKKDFENSKTKYESHLNKLADYNHLKVIVLEDDFIEQAGLYEGMIDYLAETEEYPRNTYICVVDDGEEIMELEDKLPTDLGTYLEEYLNNKEMHMEKGITLGDLIDEKENKKMMLYLPYLEVEDTYVEWSGYCAIGSANSRNK